MASLQRIQFSGICRSTDEGISSDGQCMELVNARIRHGSVEPVGRPVPVASLGISGLKAVYWHAMGGRYIAVTDGAVYSVGVDETTHAATAVELGSGLAGVRDVQFVGYVVCMDVAGTMTYAIYDKDKKSCYRMIGTAPELPRLTFTIATDTSECVLSDDAGGNKYYAARPNRETDIANTVDYGMSGCFRKLVSKLNAEGIFAGVTFVLVRYALRMSTGDYAFHSPIIVVDANKLVSGIYLAPYYTGDPTSDNAMRTGRMVCYVGDKGSSWSSLVSGKSNVRMKCSTLGFRLEIGGMTDLSAWDGLVTGVDVFVSPVSNYEDRPFSDDYETNASAYTVLRRKSAAELHEDITKAGTFYRYASFDLKGNKTWQLEDVSTDSLTVQDKLTDDAFTHNGISGASYVYNSRLHIGNISEKFFDGYAHDYGITGTGQSEGTDSLTVYTYINTTQGTVVTRRTSECGAGINPMMGYPDSRAVQMVAVKGTKRYVLPLAAHESLNMACYMAGLGMSIDGAPTLTGNVIFTRQPVNTAYFTSQTALDDSHASTDTSEIAVNDTIRRTNVLKVSALNNPLFFPSAQTYQPGNGSIIGMCANTTAMSQGQFGQHPLYVFSDDGIYTLSVSTGGSTVYTSQAPVTRDACIGAASIAGTDSAVVFATQRGLMAIQGAQARLLSGDMDGFVPSCTDSSPVIAKVAAVAKMTDALSTDDFRTYIAGARVAYNYEGGMVYVSNAAYGYMYCYDLSSGAWSKVAPNMAMFVNRYPDCYAVGSDGWLYDMQNSHRSIAQVLLLSRPVKFGTTGYKRILQTALRGVVRRSQSDLYLRGEEVRFRDAELVMFEDIGLYVLGSNDAEHFTLVSGKESITDLRDLVTRMNRGKAWKYFMVCLAGGVRTDVAINTVEFTVDVSYNNRLR